VKIHDEYFFGANKESFLGGRGNFFIFTAARSSSGRNRGIFLEIKAGLKEENGFFRPVFEVKDITVPDLAVFVTVRFPEPNDS
jgi:hypothetical protein